MSNVRNIRIWMHSIVVVVGMLACADGAKGEPSIKSIVVFPETIYINEQAEIHVTVVSNERGEEVPLDNAEVRISATTGQFESADQHSPRVAVKRTAAIDRRTGYSNGRVQFQWHAPSEPGEYYIQVEAIERGTSAVRTTTVNVVSKVVPLAAASSGNSGVREYPVLTILIDPKRPAPHDKRPSKADVEQQLFGKTNSVADYFYENSNGKMRIVNAGIIGWLDADHPWDFYWRYDKDSSFNPANPKANIPKENRWKSEKGAYGRPPGYEFYVDDWGLVGGQSRRWVEAVKKADAIIDFSKYDRDGNGFINPDELGVYIVTPQSGGHGSKRDLLAQHRPTNKQLTVDGVRIPIIGEAYIGQDPELGLLAHELAHLLVNAPDMYFQANDDRFNTWPYASREFSLMDQHFKHPHMDVWEKVQQGWLTPQVIKTDGVYTLPDIERSHQAFKLRHPSRGDREYYLLANRWPGKSYDKNLPDTGLAIWHIVDDTATLRSATPPYGVHESVWSLIPRERARAGVRLIRPVMEVEHVIPSIEPVNINGDRDSEVILTGLDRIDRDIPFVGYDQDAAGSLSESVALGASMTGKGARTIAWNCDADANEEVASIATLMSGDLAISLFDVDADGRLQIAALSTMKAVFADAVAGNVDTDPEEELIVVANEGLKGEGRSVLWIYEPEGPDKSRLKRLGDIRFEGTDAQIRLGNFDNDPQNEIALTAQVSGDGNPHLAIRIYDYFEGQGLRLLWQYGVTANNAVLATGNFDDEPLDEIAVVAREGEDGAGRLRIWIYEPEFDLKLVRIADSAFEASNPSLIVGNLDGDDADELIVSVKEGRDGKGRLVLWELEPDGRGGLTQLADTRFELGRAALDVGQIDSVQGNEIVMVAKDGMKGDGALVIKVVKRQGNQFVLVGEASLSASNPTLKVANVDADDQEEILLSVNEGKNGSGRACFFVYEPTNTVKLRRINVDRIGGGGSRIFAKKSLWDGSDPETGYDILAHNPDPSKVILRWHDGTPTGFAITNLSAAGPSMTMNIKVPQ